jgi:hypothetical protein
MPALPIVVLTAAWVWNWKLELEPRPAELWSVDVFWPGTNADLRNLVHPAYS